MKEMSREQSRHGLSFFNRLQLPTPDLLVLVISFSPHRHAHLSFCHPFPFHSLIMSYSGTDPVAYQAPNQEKEREEKKRNVMVKYRAGAPEKKNDMEQHQHRTFAPEDNLGVRDESNIYIWK